MLHGRDKGLVVQEDRSIVYVPLVVLGHGGHAAGVVLAWVSAGAAVGW